MIISFTFIGTVIVFICQASFFKGSMAINAICQAL